MAIIDSVAVVIPAFNAGATIGAAVASALEHAEVEQVIVIDDASKDDTVVVARRAAGNDPRFVMLEQGSNRGPSAARNRAIALCTADWIALLDADDQFLAGRFSAMRPSDRTEIFADNIMFVGHTHLDADGRVDPTLILHGEDRYFFIDFEGFVLANFSRPDRLRGELGFIKPVIRRSLFARFNLHYAENCRLGEDFLLYAEALARGARFEISLQTGYAALRQGNSLSLRHGAAELEHLLSKSTKLHLGLAPGSKERRALGSYLRALRHKLDYREVLDRRRKLGLLSGLTRLARSPAVAGTILKDKILASDDPIGACGLLISLDDIAAFGTVTEGNEQPLANAAQLVEHD